MSIIHLLDGTDAPLNINCNNITINGTQTGGGGGGISQFSYNTTMTGIWAAPLPVTLYLTRLGDVVFCSITGAALFNATNTATYISFTDPVPILYRPYQQTYCPIIIVNNFTANGILSVTVDGTIRVYPVGTTNTFQSGVSGGINGVATYSWQTE